MWTPLAAASFTTVLWDSSEGSPLRHTKTFRAGLWGHTQGAGGTLQRQQWRLRRLCRSVNLMHPDETPEQTLERRLRESRRVDERVIPISTYEELQEELAQAGHKLVVLEVESTTQCDSGLSEEAELQWKEDRLAALDRCKNIKHVFQRVARDSPDVIFLQLEAETEEGQEACEKLGVQTIPTVQFWKDGAKLWEHRGVVQLDQGLGEGVLFYGDTAADGLKPSDFVKELSSREELRQFVEGQDDRVLTVLNLSLLSAAGCIHIFPAILALARNFQGFAAFGRLMIDVNEETREIARELKVQQVPTFVFYRGGKEVGRHVGSSRADLIGQILQLQAQLGITPPPPQPAQRPAPART